MDLSVLQIAPKDRRDMRSPLMRAKAIAGANEKVNFCPFGCTVEDIDENGYCDHVIGFTNDGKTYEPMILGEDGRRRVKVDMAKVGERRDAKGKMHPIMKPVLPSLLPTDKLVQITTSSRVYRDVNAPAVPELESVPFDDEDGLDEKDA